MIKHTVKLFVFLCFFITSGCLEMISLDSSKQSPKEISPLPHSVYVLSSEEQATYQFDTNNGAPSTASLVDLTKPAMWAAKVNDQLQTPTMLSLPSQLPTLVLDGYHALSWRTNSTIQELYLSRTYAELDGTIKIGSLRVGAHSYARSTGLAPKGGAIYKASLAIKSDAISAGTLRIWFGFLTIKDSFYIGKDWLNPPSRQGLVIDKIFVEDRQSISKTASFRNSYIKAPSVSIKPQAVLIFENTHSDNTKGFKIYPESLLVIRNTQQNKNIIKGNFISATNSNISFILRTWEHESIERNSAMGSLNVEGSAVIQGNIAIDADHFGSQNFSSAMNRFLASQQNKMVLIKAQKLYGKTSLKMAKDLIREFGALASLTKNNMFENYLQNLGKKLALEHDYNQGTLSIRIIDQSLAVDENGCLPDIGSYDPTEAQRLADSL